MSMEKITKEELLKELGKHILSDDELENVSGGTPEEFDSCMNSCVSKHHSDNTAFNNCIKTNCEKFLFTW